MAKSTSSIDASIEFLRDFVFVEKAPTEQEQKLSQEELDALHSVILGAIVVSFDHEIGATIETFYPDSLEKYQDTSWWTKLPNFALADGIHTADLDMVLFQIQDDDSDLVVYCCAYFRQVHAKSISPSQSSGTNSPRTPSTSTPRSRMQKSVVLVSRKPCYSFMVDTLELYAAKYFSVKNYCDERVMSRMLRHVAHEKVHVDATDQTVCAMDLRWFVAKYGRQFLRIFKGLLINCTTCVYALPVKDACSAAILLASFIPMLCPDLTPEQCKQFSQSIPYLPVTEIDGFLKTCDPSKVCSFGSSSMLYVVHPHKLMDVSADVVNGVVKYSEKCEKALKLSYADAVCIDYILQEIQDSHRGPDWIRRRLYEYIQSFLGFHAKTEAESSNGFRLALLDLNHDYNKEWSERFSKTALFEYIYSVYNQNHGKGKIVPVQPTEHPFHAYASENPKDYVLSNAKVVLDTGIATAKKVPGHLRHPGEKIVKPAISFASYGGSKALAMASMGVRTGFGMFTKAVSSVLSGPYDGPPRLEKIPPEVYDASPSSQPMKKYQVRYVPSRSHLHQSPRFEFKDHHFGSSSPDPKELQRRSSAPVHKMPTRRKSQPPPPPYPPPPNHRRYSHKSRTVVPSDVNSGQKLSPSVRSMN